MPCTVPGEEGFKGGCYGGDGNYMDDGQNYRGLLIPVSVTFIPVRRAGLLRRLEGGDKTRCAPVAAVPPLF